MIKILSFLQNSSNTVLNSYHCSRPWWYSSEKNRQNPCPQEAQVLVKGDRQETKLRKIKQKWSTGNVCLEILKRWPLISLEGGELRSCANIWGKNPSHSQQQQVHRLPGESPGENEKQLGESGWSSRWWGQRSKRRQQILRALSDTVGTVAVTVTRWEVQRRISDKGSTRSYLRRPVKRSLQSLLQKFIR